MDRWNKESVSREEFLRLRKEAAMQLARMAQRGKGVSGSVGQQEEVPAQEEMPVQEAMPQAEEMPQAEAIPAAGERAGEKAAEDSPPGREDPTLRPVAEPDESADEEILPQPEPPDREPAGEKLSDEAEKASLSLEEKRPPAVCRQGAKLYPDDGKTSYHPDADRFFSRSTASYHPDAQPAGAWISSPALRKSLRRLWGEESKKK